RAGLAVAAGAALAAAFAPLNLWPLAVLCPAMLLLLWQVVTAGEAARLGFCRSCAIFPAGTYWLYVSIIFDVLAPLWLHLVLLIVPWALGAALHGHSWTQAAGAPVSVAVVQAAIPQDEKWLESNRDTTLEAYQTLTEKALGTQLIVWPESAPADVANDLVPYLSHLYSEAYTHGSALVLGVLRAQRGAADNAAPRYFNSVLALDQKVSWYDKHHLVPFAEVFPVPRFVRSWMRLMSLPYSDFTPGAADQPPLPAAHLRLGATVCYEDAYGSSMLRVLPAADALVNVTNDAWFGHSSARHQHFQIARMRALEEGRFLVRAANDGISAVIGPPGEVIARAPEFRPW